MASALERCALAACVAAAALSCASGGPPSAGDEAAMPILDRLVVATFRSTHPSYWQPVVADLRTRYAIEPLGAWPMESLAEECVLFKVPTGRTAAEIVDRIGRLQQVTLAAPVRRFRTLGEPSPWNDTYAGLQHGLVELGAAAAQRWATGKGVRIAVVDTGVDLSHPDLVGRVTAARNFVAGGQPTFSADAHGTAVAGVIAAAANNGVGVVGVAPDSELLAFKACWPDPAGSRQATCDTYTLARAVDAALGAEVRVLNLSLAGPEDPLLARLLGRAEEIGTLVVAAFDDSGAASFPASLSSVLAVGAAEPDGGPTPPPAGAGRPRLRAPAAEILTTGPSGSYDFFSGSSLAAAQASAVAALLLERRPELTPSELRELLAPAAAGDGARLNACAALGRAVAADACAGPPPAP